MTKDGVYGSLENEWSSEMLPENNRSLGKQKTTNLKKSLDENGEGKELGH